jgi:uncharacterized membrane protein YfcA
MVNIGTVLRKELYVFIVLLCLAAAFRIAVAHWLPNDAPDDGRVYAQFARNLLERHVYTHATEPPYDPSLIRLPGYPFFLAGVYSIFGHTNNGAVRIAQALIDTATCGLIALLAFWWQPEERKKRASAIAALALAALCPFTTIYAATILTEVPTNFLLVAMFVAATLALRKQFTTEDTEGEKDKKRFRKTLFWWIVAGLIGGVAVLFRPDNGLFVAAVGLTLVIGGALGFSPYPLGRGARGEGLARRKPSPQPLSQGERGSKIFAHTLLCGALFSVTFMLVLTPWTIRNWRLFHVFQPLSPAHAEMPGEFVPRGYGLWLRTWLDDESYVAPMLWSLDTARIDIDDVPSYAFDSAEEKDRVSALLDKYNYPDGKPATSPKPPQAKSETTPQLLPSASPSNDKTAKGTPNPAQAAQNKNANIDEKSEDESGDEESDEEESENEPGSVEMTPEIDAGFAQLALERIARHRFNFYVWLPIKRARTMWFDTHSQYWPFEGTLLPFEDLDYQHHQHIWLPLFAALTALYTMLGLAGAWFMWTAGKFEARQWVSLIVLAIVLRLILFSSIENPEPRYLVESFPMLSILAGIAIATLLHKKEPQVDTDKPG